LQLCGHVIGNE